MINTIPLQTAIIVLRQKNNDHGSIDELVRSAALKRKHQHGMRVHVARTIQQAMAVSRTLQPAELLFISYSAPPRTPEWITVRPWKK